MFFYVIMLLFADVNNPAQSSKSHDEQFVYQGCALGTKRAHESVLDFVRGADGDAGIDGSCCRCHLTLAS